MKEFETYWMMKLNTLKNGLNMVVSNKRIRILWEQGKIGEWKRAQGQYTWPA
jgi:hypothetical protein